MAAVSTFTKSADVSQHGAYKHDGEGRADTPIQGYDEFPPYEDDAGALTDATAEDEEYVEQAADGDEDTAQQAHGSTSTTDHHGVVAHNQSPPEPVSAPTGLARARTASSVRRAPNVPAIQRFQSAIMEAEVSTPHHSTPSYHTSRPQSVRGDTLGARPLGDCYLSRAIQSAVDNDYVSSSSSEDDEDAAPAADGPARAQATRAKKQRLGKSKGQRPGAQRPTHDLLNGSDGDNHYRRFLVGNENYQTKGRVKKDGRLRITVNETKGTGYIAKALGAAIYRMRPVKEHADEATKAKSRARSELSPTPSFSTDDVQPLPRLNIVVMVIGSRGDVQPFLQVGKILKEKYGHRVRIATHPTFREYVEKESGLEFFSVGGDPSELMAFMVKNPGMIPTLETVRAGDIGKRRAAMAGMFEGFWRACISSTDDETDAQNLKLLGTKDPFVADAIIANPPSFAHVHCAEALGIPLHLMFTFPYTPTQAFPHPLASIKQSNVDPGYTNFISYPLVEMMIWQGLGDLVNGFRVRTLGLDPVSTLWAPGATYRMHVPFTYLWSPGLVPKPRDWGDHIDISGFVYLDLASNFTPPRELEDFLNAGPPPVYIGFGSIVVDDADSFTQMIFEGVKKAGVRALVSRGWGGFGSDTVPDNIFMLGNTPHDWLFPRVSACVIHGGAGTTAIALKTGRPTMVVPFFGDQHFWGLMTSNAGVGPEPVPYKDLTADKLAEGIKYCLTDEARSAAGRISRDIEHEGEGAVNAVRSFHRHLQLRGPNTMRCSVLRDRVAVWQIKNSHVKLSPLAADVLVDAGLVSWRRLRLLRHNEWNDFGGPGEPVTGIAGSLAHTARTVGGGPYRLAKTSKRYKERLMKKRRRGGGKGGASGSEALAPDPAAAPAPAPAPPPVPAVLPSTDQTLAQKRTTTRDIHGEFIGDVTTGVGRTASALAKAPVDLSLALAQGFHNAPRLYGDDTVRRPVRITGVYSGLRAARKEFVYGIYDGFTGMIRLPYRGAKQNGTVGLAKGVGMGVLGLGVKNASAIVGPLGYTLKGLVKQAERTRGPTRSIRRARIAQGQRAVQSLGKQELIRTQREVVSGVYVMLELCEAIMAEGRRRGIVGHVDRLLMDTAPLFEDVATARRALRALQRGETLESLVRPLDDGAMRWICDRKAERSMSKQEESNKSARSSRSLSFKWRRDRGSDDVGAENSGVK